MKKLILCVLLVMSLATAKAQTVNTKMGNPTMEEMTMTSYEADPDAKAVILYESNESAMQVVGNQLKLVMTYKRRVKVLAEEGLDVADVTLTMQDAVSATDIRNEIHDLKATAYNLVGGKIEKTKMTNATVSKQRINDYVTQTHFVIPQVQVGSVVEYQYKMYFENYMDIPTWVAQCKYPVLRSEYTIGMPDSFVFSFQQTGAHQSNHTKKDTRNPSLDTNDVEHTFVWDKLPALPKDNEYLYCPTDFADKVTCELTSIHIPGVISKTFAVSQEDINKRLLNNDNFGGRLKQKNPLRKEMEAAGIASITDNMERAKATIEMLKKNVRWDGNYNLGGTSLSKVLKEGTGDNADMNFILISMLRDVDVKCYPIVMSRRSRGRMPITHPSLDALNTFCVGIFENDSTLHFYDSSAENGYFDVLPSDMNVDRAILIYDDIDDWATVSPQPAVKSKEVISINGSISADGILTANNSTAYGGLDALKFRNSWENKNDSTAFVEAIAAAENIEIQDYATQDREAFSPQVTERYSFTKQLDGDGKFFINPLILSSLRESPFKSESSTMPVEFPAVSSRTFVINIDLPEGYRLEENIRSLSASLPDNGGSVRIMANVSNGRLTVSAKININKVFFTADEYPQLKEFFDLIAQKCNEMIVISKE